MEPVKNESTVRFRGNSQALRTLSGFTQIPNVVLRHPELSAAAKLIYGLLLSYSWQDDFCFPAQKQLMVDASLTDKPIHKALQELKRHKLIDWNRQGQGKPNIYYILEDFYTKQSSGGNQNRRISDSRIGDSPQQESENLRNLPLEKDSSTNTHTTEAYAPSFVCEGIFKSISPDTILKALPDRDPAEIQDRMDQINLLVQRGEDIRNPVGFLLASFSKPWGNIPGHIPRSERKRREEVRISRKIRKRAQVEKERQRHEEEVRRARETFEELPPETQRAVEKAVIASEPGLEFVDTGTEAWQVVFNAALVEVITNDH